MKTITENDITMIYPGCSTADDGEDLMICSVNGFAGCQGLEIGGYLLSWPDVDKLRKAIALAEKSWR